VSRVEIAVAKQSASFFMALARTSKNNSKKEIQEDLNVRFESMMMTALFTPEHPSGKRAPRGLLTFQYNTRRKR
jgi:hypothetical protein